MIPAMRITHIPALSISIQEEPHLILSLLINHKATTRISFFITHTQSLLN